MVGFMFENKTCKYLQPEGTTGAKMLADFRVSGLQTHIKAPNDG